MASHVRSQKLLMQTINFYRAAPITESNPKNNKPRAIFMTLACRHAANAGRIDESGITHYSIDLLLKPCKWPFFRLGMVIA
jgi:hypothetical protein